MADGYAKLWSSILDSSIWAGESDTRVVWVTLLLMADADGRVEASVNGIAHRAHVPIEACRDALQAFQQPDPESKDPEHDGRRIARVTGGFQVLNHPKYRARKTKGQELQATRTRRWREQQQQRKKGRTSRGVT